jgi:hypothetical protein
MDNENENLSEEVVEEEEETTTEDAPTFEEDPEEDNFVKIPKDKFKKMQHKAMAYDASKNKQLPTRDSEDPIVKKVEKLETIEAKRQFGYENGLSPQETDFVFRISGGKPDKKILEDPFVKSGLEGYRASKRVENNTPGTNSKSPIFQGKKYDDMSEEERRKSFEEHSPIK